MAFTYDPTTNRGKVRLGLVDTHRSSSIFTDVEIDEFLADGGSVDGGINQGLRVLMAHASIRGDQKRVNAIRDTLRLRGGEMPEAQVTYPDKLPMDTGFDEPRSQGSN